MRMTTEELKSHAEKAFKFYQIELGAPEGAYWLVSPRDFHVLLEAFQEDKKKSLTSGEFPTLLGVPAVVAYVWRKPPVIFMNVRDVDFDLENEPSDAKL